MFGILKPGQEDSKIGSRHAFRELDKLRPQIVREPAGGHDEAHGKVVVGTFNFSETGLGAFGHEAMELVIVSGLGRKLSDIEVESPLTLYRDAKGVVFFVQTSPKVVHLHTH
jgi:hypothetical protein